MRALIISDIHSNIEALQAVLAAAPAHDSVWNLGDIVGYAANPNEVIDVVRKLAAVSIRGNHDRACTSMAALEDFSPIADRAVQWTRRVLTREHQNWLADLPAGPLSPNGAEVSCVHGSPIDEDEYLVCTDDAVPALRAARARVTFFGHTHRQVGFAGNGEDTFSLGPIYSSEDEADQYELPLRGGFHYLLNPGSVGQPRDGDWRAAFAIYDQARALFTWHRVPYDLDTTQAGIRRAGLPDILADRLRDGR
jgi:diadenosine tetraphosphatase ApaH/serine/threonine PP2A family protein phosphatase